MARKPNECVRPGAVTDDDLLACARGEAPPAVVEHVTVCPVCRARVAAYATLDRRLLAGLLVPACPPSLTLAEFLLDLLPAEQRAAVADHVATCAQCSAMGRALRPWLGLPGASAPPAGNDQPPSDMTKSPQASATGSVAVSVRADGGTHYVTASGVRLTLAVHCACRLGGGAITGCLEPVPAILGDARAVLYQDGLSLAVRPLDAAGGFAFTGLAPGTYRVELTVAPAVVVIAPVRVP